MIRRLRIWYMHTTTVSARWAGSRGYIRFLYALWSRLYDLSVGLDPAFRRNAHRMTAATVAPGDRVLDVGIGTGLLAEYAAAYASEYVGVDYSGAMLAQAARKVARRRLEKVTLRWCDARSLPFAASSFDAVVSSFVLPHFAPAEKVEILREMGRVLRPGGRLGLFLAQGEIAPLFSTRGALENALEEAGFERVVIEDHDDVYRVVRASRPVDP